MEAALKQTVAIKEKVEEDYKQVDEHYKSAKVCIMCNVYDQLGVTNMSNTSYYFK